MLRGFSRAVSSRLRAMPGYEVAARWLGVLTPVGWSVSAALVAGVVASVVFGWIEGFIVAVF